MVKYLQNKDIGAETTILERFFSGAMAGFFSQTVIYPLDVCSPNFYFNDHIELGFKPILCLGS